ncbi:Uma2 family endonuclease [Nocardioides rubriscoriae]|uniref:Uma2 family endonuclease n=1 Tax=Nocardioides rubriscoriae TaxID=642762 RepID=UPI001FEC5FB2|nr:Uma2 family endonuclease [Nocardioides rubriscoriae]
MTTMPRAGRGLTVADLDGFPDDGWRYELLDGTLLVSAAPSVAHQRASLRLTLVLAAACPPHLELLAAPLDVVLDDRTQLQPDLVVAPRAQFTAANLPGAPLLAVEILSPSTRLIDLNLKRARFEQAGAASYWVVDPVERRLTAWELVDGDYVQVADVSGSESWTASAPYDVTIVPAALVG